MSFSRTRLFAALFAALIAFLTLPGPNAPSSASSASSAPSATFREAWVFSHCKSAATFAEIHTLFAQGDVTAARMHYRLKVAAGACTDLTRYGLVVSFLGTRIAARHANPVQGKTVVLEGHIVNADDSMGERAFVWVAEEHLGNFLETLDGKPVFQPSAPEFKGWQDM